MCAFRHDLVAQLVKNWPAMQETHVQPLGWEDPLEKEMATHSSVLAWRIPGIGKDSDAGRDWGQEEKGTTEDEMAGWHH